MKFKASNLKVKLSLEFKVSQELNYKIFIYFFLIIIFPFNSWCCVHKHCYNLQVVFDFSSLVWAVFFFFLVERKTSLKTKQQGKAWKNTNRDYQLNSFKLHGDGFDQKSLFHEVSSWGCPARQLVTVFLHGMTLLFSYTAWLYMQ